MVMMILSIAKHFNNERNDKIWNQSRVGNRIFNTMIVFWLTDIFVFLIFSSQVICSVAGSLQIFIQTDADGSRLWTTACGSYKI